MQKIFAIFWKRYLRSWSLAENLFSLRRIRYLLLMTACTTDIRERLKAKGSMQIFITTTSKAWESSDGTWMIMKSITADFLRLSTILYLQDLLSKSVRRQIFPKRSLRSIPISSADFIISLISYSSDAAGIRKKYFIKSKNWTSVKKVYKFYNAILKLSMSSLHGWYNYLVTA